MPRHRLQRPETRLSISGAFGTPFLSARPTFHGTWLFILLASSSVVQIEPAPYDVLAIGLVVWALVTGLTVPSRLGLPLLMLGVFMLSHVGSAAFGIIVTQSSIPAMGIYTGQTLYLLLTMVLFAAIVAADPSSALRTIWAGYIVAAIIAVTIAALAYFDVLSNREQFILAGRARGPFKDPNVYSPFLVPVAIHALGLALTQRGWRALLASALCGYMMLGIVIAFSRGGVLNYLAALATVVGVGVLTGAFKPTWHRALPRLALLLMLAAVALGAFASTPRVQEMLEVRLSLVQRYDTRHDGRFRAQSESLRAGLANPLGTGPNVRPRSAAFADPHNVYIKVMSEYGMLGILSFLAFCGATVVGGLRDCFTPSTVRPALIVVYGCVVGNLVESLFVDTLHWRHLFLLLGMQWGLMAVVQREQLARGRAEPAPGPAHGAPA